MARRRRSETTPDPPPSERLPPHNLDAERGVLGSLMLEPGMVEVVSPLLQPEDFFREAHAAIFEAILALHERGEPAIVDLLAAELEQRKVLDQVGGSAYLVELFTIPPTGTYAPHYARAVAAEARKRQTIDLAGRLAGWAWDGSGEPELAGLRNRLEELATPPTAIRAWSAPEILATDFPPVVWAVRDLVPVGLSALGGRPKVGKSFLALQLAQAVASGSNLFDRKASQGDVLYIALEDTPARIAGRLEGQRALPDRVRGLTFAFEWPHLDGTGTAAIMGRIRHGGLRLVIVDTLSRALSRDIDQLDVSAMTASLGQLQRLALKEGVSILLSDHHRKPQAAMPDPVTDLLGTTGKAAVADAILGLYRKRGERDGTLMVAGRDAPDSELALRFDVLTLSWQLIGDARQVAHTAAEDQVLQALAELGGTADASAIGSHLGKSRNTVVGPLRRLADRGHLVGHRHALPSGGVRVRYEIAEEHDEIPF